MGMLLFPFVLNAQADGESVSPDSLAAYPSFVASDVKLFFQLIFGLAIVIILLILTLWVLRFIMRSRLTGAAGAAGDAVTVLTIRYLDPRKAVALVRIMNRVFIIGVADQSLTTLGELTPEEAGALQRDATNNHQVFANIFDRIRKRRSSLS